MSGFEAVSLVLGVMPLIISTIEHYDGLLKPLGRYKKYSSKVREFHESLCIERTMFRAECVLLLGDRVKRSEAEAMLNDTSHHLWRDETIEQALSQSFSAIGNQCGDVMQRIVTILGELSSKIREFDSLAEKTSTTLEVDQQTWLSNLKSKLRFSFKSYSFFEKKLLRLSKLNETFRAISIQVRQLGTAWSVPPPPGAQTKTSCSAKLQNFQNTRTAALDLFEVLSSTCCTQHDHYLRFDLYGSWWTTTLTSSSSLARFTVRFCQMASTAHKMTQEPLMDRPRPKPNSTDIELSVDIESALKIDSSVFLNPRPKVTIPAIADTESSSFSPKQRQDSNSPTDAIAPLATKLCVELASLPNISRSADLLKTVFIENSAVAEHKFDMRQHPALSETSSLATILSQKTKRGRTLELPLYQRLSLAACLGNSLLQLYQTPWLEEKFNSEALYFPGGASEVRMGMRLLQIGRLATSLYVSVPLRETREKIKQDLEANCSTTTLKAKACSGYDLIDRPSNGWLYHLGILLIELAYHAPFAELLQEKLEEYADASITLSPDREVAEYQIACRLADDASANLGVEYASVVKRCVRCQFQACESSNLDDSDLQEKVFDSVIRKLEMLAEGYETLQSMITVAQY